MSKGEQLSKHSVYRTYLRQWTVSSTTAMQSFKSNEMLSSESLVSSCGGSGSTMDNNGTWRL